MQGGNNLNNIENKFITEFRRKIFNTKEEFSDYVFLCIGTEKVVGDSFGPLVGENLKKFSNDRFEVIGTIRRKYNL